MSPRAASGPVTAADRVSDVLARDEALVDVFVQHAPHFSKLRNRAMRRVMARLLTVEQAARTAGIGAELLVRDLNRALGFDTAPDAAPSGAAAAAPASDDAPARALAHPANAPVVEVDVREDLRAGREPFSRIMAAAGALPEGAVLHLRAIFEPAPLFSVLGKRGFAHESLEHGPEDWSVWFWRLGVEDAGKAVAPSTPAAAAAGDAPEADEHTVVLDVRGLEPPEPLVRTLAALETLPPGHVLLQINVRVPQFLIPMLGERGYACEIDDSRADRVLVRIWPVA